MLELVFSGVAKMTHEHELRLIIVGGQRKTDGFGFLRINHIYLKGRRVGRATLLDILKLHQELWALVSLAFQTHQTQINGHNLATTVLDFPDLIFLPGLS